MADKRQCDKYWEYKTNLYLQKAHRGDSSLNCWEGWRTRLSKWVRPRKFKRKENQNLSQEWRGHRSDATMGTPLLLLLEMMFYCTHYSLYCAWVFVLAPDKSTQLAMCGLRAHFLSVGRRKPFICLFWLCYGRSLALHQDPFMNLRSSLSIRELLKFREGFQMLGNAHFPKDRCPTTNTILSQDMLEYYGERVSELSETTERHCSHI